MSRQTDHVQRKLERGWRRIPVWMSPAALIALERTMTQRDCSAQEAIRQAILVIGNQPPS